ncbi:hypothetical protein [Sphingomonas endolithica]|uniref:hypothetical protein n=1 Tax=Sphingomonas endolithica TaxID=2972485 RepID=UPI0021AEE48E|nr:hypothetical protein [Sphingomonas sp. ZFBP2030]
MTTFYAHEPHLDGTTLYQTGDKREADENDVKHLVDLKVLGDKPPKGVKPTKVLDYKADKLGAKPLTEASKDELLVIAAYEKADVPQGDAATEAELIAAIETKRKG